MQRWLTESERSTGIAVVRQHRRVSYMVLAGMLAASAEREPELLIKGGVAMELRFDIAQMVPHIERPASVVIADQRRRAELVSRPW